MTSSIKDPTVTDATLLPCPFCGKPPRTCPDDSYGAARVWCPDDNECWGQPEAWAVLANGENLAVAIERWNTRSMEAKPDPERLLELLDTHIQRCQDAVAECPNWSAPQAERSRARDALLNFRDDLLSRKQSGGGSKSLVEDMARAMCGAASPSLNPDELTPSPRGAVGLVPKWELYKHLATAAASVLKDRLPADDRELWGELWQLHRRGLSYASSVPAVNLLLADMAEGLLKAADRITALSAELERRKLRIEDADPIVFEEPQP